MTLDKLRDVLGKRTFKELSTSIRHGGAPIYGLEPHGSGCATLVKNPEDAQAISIGMNVIDLLVEVYEDAKELLYRCDTYSQEVGGYVDLENSVQALSQKLEEI